MRRVSQWFTLFLLAIGIPAAAASIPNLTFAPISDRRDMNPYSLGPGINGQFWAADLTFRQIVLFQPDGSITKIPLTSEIDPANEMRPVTIVGLLDGTAMAVVYETNGSGTPLDRTYFARITPEGSVTYKLFPPGSEGACRTLFGSPDCGILLDPDGTEVHVAATRSNKLLTMSLADGQIRELSVPGAGFIIDISPGPSDDTVALTDVIPGSLHVVNTVSGASTEIMFPPPQASPSDIARGPDGRLYVPDAANDRLLIVRGANDIDVVTLPAEGDRPLSVAAGTDDMMYLTSFGSSQLLQFNPDTKEINASPIPNGERPAELISVACPPDKPDTICMVFNSQPPASIDNNVRRAEIRAPARPEDVVENLTLQKSFRQAEAREGDQVVIDFTITNNSDASITEQLAIMDALPEGLQEVGAHTIASTRCIGFASGEILAAPADPALDGKTTIGARMSHRFSCRVRVAATGVISNQAEIYIPAAPGSGLILIPTGKKSNVATVRGIPERTLGSPPPPGVAPKILPGQPKDIPTGSQP